MVWTRFFAALIALPIIWLIILQGGLLLFLALACLLIISSYEFFKMVSAIGWPVRFELILMGVLLLLIEVQWLPAAYQGSLFLVFLLSLLVFTLVRFEQNQNRDLLVGSMAICCGVLLVGWLGRHILLLRRLDETGEILISIIGFILLADTGGFFVGRSFGKRPLSPNISPKKSVEGYWGGILFSLLLGIPFCVYLLGAMPLTAAIVVGVALPLFAPAGDLGISLLKRIGQVKDTGNIIPGHGGMLDRFDTILWGSAGAYYLLVLMGQVGFLS